MREHQEAHRGRQHMEEHGRRQPIEAHKRRRTDLKKKIESYSRGKRSERAARTSMTRDEMGGMDEKDFRR